MDKGDRGPCIRCVYANHLCGDCLLLFLWPGERRAGPIEWITVYVQVLRGCLQREAADFREEECELSEGTVMMDGREKAAFFPSRELPGVRICVCMCVCAAGTQGDDTSMAELQVNSSKNF